MNKDRHTKGVGAGSATVDSIPAPGIAHASQSAILDAMNDPVLVVDEDFRIVYWNDAATRVFGWTSDEVLGQSSAEILKTEVEGSSREEELARLFSAGEYRGEAIFRHKDGHPIYTESTSRVVRGPNGEFEQLVSVLRDITERKKDERNLLRSRQRYEILSDANSLLLSSDNAEVVIQTIAERVMRHLGADVFFNYILDSGSDRLRLNAWGGVDKSVAKMIERLELGQAICGCVAQGGERIISEDVQHNRDPRADLVRSMGVRCYCCHPLKAGGKTVGTLSFGTKRKDCFEPDEVDLMLTVANQISIAIERVRSEQQSQFQSFLLESVSDSVIVYRADGAEMGKVLYVNEAAAASRGYTREEMLRLNVVDILAPEQRQFLQSRMDRVIAGERVQAESAHLRKDGSSFPVEIWLQRLEFAGRALVVNVCRDITARKRAEEDLKRSEAEANDLIQYAPTAIYGIDFRTHRFTTVNEAMAVITGYSQDELLEMDPIDLLVPESQARFAQRTQLTLEGNEPTDEVEYVVRRKDGSEIIVQLHVRFDFDEARRPTRALVIGHDVTQRRRQEEQLRRAVRQETILRELALSSANALAETNFSQRQAEMLLELLGAKIAIVWRLDDSGEELEVAGAAGTDGPTLRSLYVPTEATGDAAVETAFQTGRPGFFRDAQCDPLPDSFREFLLPRGLRAGIALPLLVRGETIGALSVIWDEPMSFEDPDVEFLMSLASELALGLENVRLFEAERERARLGRSMVRINQDLTSSLDVDETLRDALDHVCQALGGSNATITDRVEDGWRIRNAVGSGAETFPPGTFFTDDQSPSLMRVRETRKPRIVADVFAEASVNIEAAEKTRIRAYAAYPLIARDNVVGAITVQFAEPHELSVEEQDYLRRVAFAISLAEENSRLYKTEHDIADRLQEALLALPVAVPGVEFAHAYHSATESARVGGDFYDLFPLDHEHVGIVIGDVAGKGINAAVLTSMVKNTVRAHANEQGKTPAQILRLTNDVVYKSTPTEGFVTLFVGILDTHDGRLVYGNAGHTTASVVHRDGTVSNLSATGPLVGAFDHVDFEEAETRLDTDALLFLYTDGMTEARKNGKFYGEARVFAKLSKACDQPPAAVVQGMIDDVIEFSDGHLRDDLAILAVRRVEHDAKTPHQQQLEMQ